MTGIKSFFRFLGMVREYAGMSIGHPRYKGFMVKLGIFHTLVLLTIKSKYYPNSEVEHDIFGFKVSANSPQTLLSLFIEIFIDEVYYFYSDHESPKIIDCGANMGMSVLYFKHLYPRATILAIEPNPLAVDYLEKNIRRNALTDVDVKNVCISDQVGKEKFYYSSKMSIANASLFSQIGHEYLQEVDTVLLSCYLSGEEFDLVKIDIEGAERQVFKELKSSGQLPQSKLYFIEYHQDTEYLEDVFQEMLGTFTDSGFRWSYYEGEGDKVLRFELSREEI